MKRKIILLALAVAILATCLASCQLLPGLQKDPQGFIYDKDSAPSLIFADMDMPQEYNMRLYNAFVEVLVAPPDFNTGTTDVAKHEIIVGKSNRPVSDLAYAELEKIDCEYDEFAFVIYSDGASVAIAYNVDKDFVAAQSAIDYFIENYVKESLTLTAGVAKKEIKTFTAYYEDVDQKRQEAAWQKLHDSIEDKTVADQVVEAFKAMYTIYDEKVIEWYANLYSPRKCICDNYDEKGNKVCLLPKGPDGNYLCTGGGYYYSNSARDTVGFLPDAESTSQALNFWSSSGMANMTGGTYRSAIPDWMKNEVVAFIKSLQHPNGYFYHPQWGVELTDSKISRRARDLQWCTSILKTFGTTPFYDTPNGYTGEAEPELTSFDVMTERLGTSAVIAASKVIAVEDGESQTYAEHLQDATAFMAYLNTKDLANKSYPVGNELTAQGDQIIARDKVLKEEGKQQLMPILIDWLNAGQNPKTGHWHGESNYYGVNGLLKISGIYTKAQVEMPYAEEAVYSAMDAIVSDEAMGAVVDIYNTWFAINNVTENLKNYGKERNGLSGTERAEKLIAELLEMAPAGIKKSMEKIIIFRKDDGSFSYTPKASSSTSQGVPAAVPGSNEGDVNATVISITGLLGNIYSALDLPKVPLFGEADRRYYVHLIENLGDVQKSEQPVIIDDPIGFDDVKVGTTGDSIEDLTVTMNSTGSVTVVEDTRENKKGNVLEFISVKGPTGDSVRIPNNTISNTAKCWVFEGSFLVKKDGTADNTYLTQITMGGGYMFSFRTKNGKLHVWESSSGSSSNAKEQELAILSLDEWFDLKVEYYEGTHSSVRIKFYINGELVAVTDNYLNSSGSKLLNHTGTPSKDYNNGTNIFVMKDASCAMLIDDTRCYKTNTLYSASIDPTLAVNVDSPDADSKEYDFNDGTLPEDITSAGAFEVKDGAISATLVGDNSAVLTIPVNKLKASANVTVFTTNMLISSASNGNLFSIYLRERNSSSINLLRVDVQCYTEDGAKYIRLVPAPGGKQGMALDGFKVPVGERFTFKIEYFERERIAVFYIDGELMAATDSLYSGAHRFTVGEVHVASLGGSAFDITLDNIRAERDELDFEFATRPKVDPEVQDFEGELYEGATTDGAIVDKNGNKVLKLGSGNAFFLPVNARSNYSTATVIEATFTVPENAPNGAKYFISYVDGDGNVILQLALVVKDGVVGLYESAEDSILTEPAKEYLIADAAKGITLRFEFFNQKRICNVYQAGVGILATSVYYNEAATSLSSAGMKISAEGGSIELDDVICECYNIFYKAISPVGTNPESAKPVIDFESSSTGKKPNPVTSNLASSGAAIRVERMLNAYTGKMSNALVFTTAPGGNDSLRIGVTEQSTVVKSYVFEADIYIDPQINDAIYQFSFENANTIRLNMLQFTYTGGKITIADVSSNNSSDDGIKRYTSSSVAIGNAKEWIHLRIEVYTGVDGGMRTKIFVNDSKTPVFVGDNYWGRHKGTSPNTEVTRVQFYTLSSASATMYLDNVSLVKSDVEYDGAEVTHPAKQ